MKRPKLFEYYRQFEAMSPEEGSRRLRRKRDEERSQQVELAPQLDLARLDWHGPPDPEVVNAATFALRRALNRYPGAESARARGAVAAHHDVAPEQVALGHGAGQLLQAALRRLAVGGDAVLPWPSWEALPALAARAGARPVPVRLRGDGGVDLEALARTVDDNTRAVVICSPNDPTGALVERDDLRDFAAALPHHVSLLLDEALVDFVADDRSGAALVADAGNVIVFRSLSKAWALAGLRAGYAIGPPEAEPLLAELEPGLGVSAPAVAAITSTLEPNGRARAGLERRRRTAAAERERLGRALTGTPYEFLPSETHFVWLRGEGLDARALTDELAKRRIAVKPGNPWGDDARVRVTLRDRLTTERLVSALEEISSGS